MPCAWVGGGSGKSTPAHVFPAFEEKYARIGRRKISFDPATISFGFSELIAIDVSLCGPGSSLTSTFGPTETVDLELAARLLVVATEANAAALPHHDGDGAVEAAEAIGAPGLADRADATPKNPIDNDTPSTSRTDTDVFMAIPPFPPSPRGSGTHSVHITVRPDVGARLGGLEYDAGATEWRTRCTI